MTRKDFELIAAAVASARHNAPDTASVDKTARVLSNALATTNARFDKLRFLKACDYYGEAR